MTVLLDAFSGAAVGGDGYADHFDEIVCLDSNPTALKWAAQGGHEVVLDDAMKLLNDPVFMAQFDALHASPPCQAFTAARELAKAQGKASSKKAVDLLRPTIGICKRLDMPWVIENVPRSPLKRYPSAIRLCGSSFGLKVQRHRLFLSNVPLPGPPRCDHASFDIDPDSGKPRPWGVYYAAGDRIPAGGRTCDTLEHAMECMGVTREVPWDWLKEGLPPAYTRWLGGHLVRALELVA